jgi:hypothetical protein
MDDTFDLFLKDEIPRFHSGIRRITVKKIGRK